MALYSDLNHTGVQYGSTIYDLDALYQAVMTLLSTRKRSKVFRPEIGCDLDRYLFEPCDQITADAILFEITDAFSQDPRFKLDMSRTHVTPSPMDSSFYITLAIAFPALNNNTYSIPLVLKNEGV